MSDKAAEAWLNSHDNILPAFDDYHHRVIEMLEQGIASMGEIADVIMLDPGMNCLLLHQVNSKLKKSRRPTVDSVHIAIGHLGKPAVIKLLKQQKTLTAVCDNKLARQSYRQILSKVYHALAQMKVCANLQGIKTIDDMCSATLLRALGELLVCLFDAERYQQYLQQCINPKTKNPAENIFDFTFNELGKQLANKYDLPELLSESFQTGKNTGLKARVIQLATDLADQAELGWQHQGMQNSQKNYAEFLKLKPGDALQQIIATSLQAARESQIEEVFPAAARLILLPDIEKAVAPAKTVSKPTAEKPPLSDQLKGLLKLPNLNQNLVLGFLLQGLQQHLKFSRVTLMLLSRDNRKLVTRASKGLDSDSAFLKLTIDTAQAGLLKSILQKPQALAVNATSYKKYESMLPGKFKAACLCDSFVLMSVFIGNKPVGLIYADRSSSQSDIDNRVYQEFKTSIITSSKILTYLSKRKSQAAA